MSGHTAAGEQRSACSSWGGWIPRFKFQAAIRSKLPALFFLMGVLYSLVPVQPGWAQGAATPDATAEASADDADSTPKGLDTPIFDVAFTDQKLTEVVDLLSTLGGVNINVAGNVDPKIVVNLNVKTQKTIREVLDDMATLYGLWIDYQADSVMIRPGTDKPVAAENIVEKQFPVRFNRPSEMLDLVRNFLSNSPSADALALDNQKLIMVRDIPEALARIEEFLNRVDIPKQSTVFPILYGDPNEVADMIRERLPDLEEGALTVDVANSQLIVRTTLENLQEIQQLVETIDIKKEIRVFTISFHEVEDVVDMLDELGLLSEEGKLVSNEYTGKIIVQDTPERLDRIAEAIKAYDLPRPAVFVEAEILNVDSRYAFNWNPTVVAGDAVENETSFLGRTLLDGQSILQLTGSGAVQFAALDAGNLLATLQATESETQAQTIASPRLIVERKEEARLTVGSEEPIGVRSFRDDIYSGSSRDIVTQRVREVGIRLIVEAMNISEKGYVELYIGLENSELPPDGGRVDIGGDTTGLRVLTANIETTAVLKDGRTLAIGGLLQRGIANNNAGPPFINKVPVFKYFFSSLSKADNRRKLLLFITPHILNLDTPFEKYEQDEESFSKLEGKRKTTMGDAQLAGIPEGEDLENLDWSTEGEPQWINRNGRWGYLDESGNFVDRTAEFMSAYDAGKAEPLEEPSAFRRELKKNGSSASEMLRQLEEPEAATPREAAPPVEEKAPAESAAEPQPSAPDAEAAPKKNGAGGQPQTAPRAVTPLEGEDAVQALRKPAASLGSFKGTFRDLIRQVGEQTGVKFGINRAVDRQAFESPIEIDATNKTYDQVMHEALEKHDMTFRYRKDEAPQILKKSAPAGKPAATAPPAVNPPSAPAPAPTQPVQPAAPVAPASPQAPADPSAAPSTGQPQTRSGEEDLWSDPPLSKGWAPSGGTARKNQEWTTLSGTRASGGTPMGQPSGSMGAESWEVPYVPDESPVPNVGRKLSPPAGFESRSGGALTEETWDNLLDGRSANLSQARPVPPRHIREQQNPRSRYAPPPAHQAEPVAMVVPQTNTNEQKPEPKKGMWSKMKKLLTPDFGR